jgi:hypothetical protein
MHMLMFWRVAMCRNPVSECAAASVFRFGRGLEAECIHRAPIENIWPEAIHTCICLCFWCLVMLQNSALGNFNNFGVWLLVRLESNMRSQNASRQHMAGWKNMCLFSCVGHQPEIIIMNVAYI